MLINHSFKRAQCFACWTVAQIQKNGTVKRAVPFLYEGRIQPFDAEPNATVINLWGLEHRAASELRIVGEVLLKKVIPSKMAELYSFEVGTDPGGKGRLTATLALKPCADMDDLIAFTQKSLERMKKGDFGQAAPPPPRLSGWLVQRVGL